MRYYYLSYDAIKVEENFPQGGSGEARRYILCTMKKIGFLSADACTETTIRFGIPDNARIIHDEILFEVERRLGDRFAFSLSLSAGNSLIQHDEDLQENTLKLWKSLECD